ncbi:MAG: hypothetical protein OQJ76_00620 [Rhodospirillales bacterium]|nr:hypothetical protein [Rhodospirillales bacterium]
MRRTLLSMALTFMLTASGAAQTVDHAQQYEACMALVHRDAEKAFESAGAWEGIGGGDPARHCAAVALNALGHHADAAERLETLATDIKADAAFKAKILGQAGQAWLLAGAAERASEVLDIAVNLSPTSPALLIDRAQARAALAQYWEAIDDLNSALERDPELVDALVFRASAYRHLDSAELAQGDIESALALDPNHPEALLEKGIVARIMGDTGLARRSWLRLLEIAPGSPAARAARDNLEAMDVNRDK